MIVYLLYMNPFNRLFVILNNHDDMKQAMVKQPDDFSHRPSTGMTEAMAITDGWCTINLTKNIVCYYFKIINLPIYIDR